MDYTLTEKDERRFASKIDSTGECWEWLGSHFIQTGYALFNVKCSDTVWRPTVAHPGRLRDPQGAHP